MAAVAVIILPLNAKRQTCWIGIQETWNLSSLRSLSSHSILKELQATSNLLTPWGGIKMDYRVRRRRVRADDVVEVERRESQSRHAFGKIVQVLTNYAPDMDTDIYLFLFSNYLLLSEPTLDLNVEVVIDSHSGELKLPALMRTRTSAMRSSHPSISTVFKSAPCSINVATHL